MKTILLSAVVGLASAFGVYAVEGSGTGCAGTGCNSAACREACGNMACCQGGSKASEVRYIAPESVPADSNATVGKPSVQYRLNRGR